MNLFADKKLFGKSGGSIDNSMKENTMPQGAMKIKNFDYHAPKDLKLILLVGLMSFFFSIIFQVFERLSGLFTRLEFVQFDEFIIALSVVAVTSLLLLLLRIKELRREIGSRQRVEEKYEYSERILRTLMENLPDEIYAKDRQHRFTLANKSVLKKLKLNSQKDILGKTDFDFHDEKKANLYWKEEDEIFKTGKPIIEVEHVDESREKKRWFLTTKVPIKNYDGKIVGLVGINRDITRKKLIEQSLIDSKEKYERVIQNANESIVIGQDGRLKFANPKTEALLGRSLDEIYSQPFTEFIHPDDRELVVTNYKRRLAGDPALPEVYEFRVINSRGDTRWVELRGVRTLWEGRPATLNFIADVTERLKAEETIRASLREKEVLLKEIHHRVKNNMQIISSLLNLQASKVKDKEALEALLESQNRVRSMAYIHEKLYQSKNLSEIEFGNYLEQLAYQLFSSYRVSTEKVKLKLNTNGLLLDVNKAIPCGLIINELVSNSLKYAFPDGRKGEIFIDFHQKSEQPDADKRYLLRVKDNGIGFPDDIDFRNTNSLGLQLVCTLTDQLSGHIKMIKKGGTEFLIEF